MQMQQLEQTNRERLEHQEQVTSITAITYRTLIGYYDTIVSLLEENYQLEIDLEKTATELSKTLKDCSILQTQVDKAYSELIDLKRTEEVKNLVVDAGSSQTGSITSNDGISITSEGGSKDNGILTSEGLNKANPLRNLMGNNE